MTDKEIISEAPRELKESIKLTLNTKGYGWEIRIHIEDREGIDNDKLAMERISLIDNQMKERFGNEN